jgi:hypothetical protein
MVLNYIHAPAARDARWAQFPSGCCGEKDNFVMPGLEPGPCSPQPVAYRFRYADYLLVSVDRGNNYTVIMADALESVKEERLMIRFMWSEFLKTSDIYGGLAVQYRETEMYRKRQKNATEECY